MRKSGNTTLRDSDNDKNRYDYFCVPNAYFKSYVTHKFFRSINVGTVMKFSDRYLTINVMLGG